jgi:hypothetical protein
MKFYYKLSNFGEQKIQVRSLQLFFVNLLDFVPQAKITKEFELSYEDFKIFYQIHSLNGNST